MKIRRANWALVVMAACAVACGTDSSSGTPAATGGASPTDEEGGSGGQFAEAGSGGTTASPPGVCEPGRQLSCACPGGVEGYQVCAADGDTWEQCVCPPTPGASGAGGATHSGDEPCPPLPAVVNCSDQCGGPTDNCTQVECPNPPSFVMTYPSVSGAWVRTPSAPGVDRCGCQDAGVSSPPEYAMVVRVPWNSNMVLRADVAPPWQLRAVEPDGTVTHCNVSDGSTCVLFGSRSDPMLPDRIYIFTYEANAPASNVAIRRAAAGETCP